MTIKALLKSVYCITLLLLFLGSSTLYAKQAHQFESQAEILFKFDKLQKNQSNLALQVEFNKAVLLLEKGKYLKAIDILKTTARYMKIPSFLNIGIAYYKLGAYHNAKIYLDRIYDFDEAENSHTYSYMSAGFYLYQISGQKNYLEKIIKIAARHQNLSEHSKRLIVDTLIILKKYDKALKMLNTMKYPLDLKRALLQIKLNDYTGAEISLKKAYETTFNPTKLDEILWFMVYRDLKSNQIGKLVDHIDMLNQKKGNFRTNQTLPLKIYFNKNKYTPQEYIEFVTKFDENRRMDFLFYFAPYVFSDNEEIIYDIARGFVFQQKQNIQSLDEMIEYNKNFLRFVKKDPIIRAQELNRLLIKDTKSYIYYNIAICYAQISDYHNAFNFFEKAYKLNPGNKLFSAMTLVTAKRIGFKLTDYDYIEANLRSDKGLYSYFGHTIYKMYINPKFEMTAKPENYDQTVFYKSLKYLQAQQDGSLGFDNLLFEDHFKDPLVYLMKMFYRQEYESEFGYFSRLQDSIPLVYNNNFLEGPLIVTQYYIDGLKALGLFFKADLNITGEHSPSYLRTKALRDLHVGNPRATVNILEYLQKTYDLEDKYTLYLIVAGLLEDNRYQEASLQISLIKNLLNDSGADFLTGVQLIQDLKLSSVRQYFKEPYYDTLIDFQLVGFDKYLESL